MALARSTPQSESGPGRNMQFADAGRPRPVGLARSPARGAADQYQRAQVETASPTRLVVLLYEGAIRFCRLAQEAMRAKDLEAQNSNLIRAQRIVAELLASLNRSAGGEVASNLARIYTHLIEELVKANLYDEPEKLSHVIKLLIEMHASWIEIDSTAGRDGKTGEPARASDAAARANPGVGGANHGGASVRTATNAGSAAPALEALTRAGGARLGDRLA